MPEKYKIPNMVYLLACNACNAVVGIVSDDMIDSEGIEEHLNQGGTEHAQFSTAKMSKKMIVALLQRLQVDCEIVQED